MTTIASSAPAGAPAFTKVVGFFNQQDFPMSIHCPELNRTILLGPREYLCRVVEGVDSKGRPTSHKEKINDPIFEKYVGPNKLGKEVGDVEVPITWLPRPVLQATPTSMFEFAGSANFKTDDSGNVIRPGFIGEQQQTSAPASASSVGGYSMEQARQLGVIRPVEKGMIREEHEVPVNKEVPVNQRPAPLPKGTPPIQPNSTRPVPPPYKAPIDTTLRAPRSTQVAPALLPTPRPTTQSMPTATVPPAMPVAPASAAPSQVPPAQVPEPNLADLTEPADLMEDIQGDGKISVEELDLGAIAREQSRKAGLAVPELKLPEPDLTEKPILQAPASEAPAELVASTPAPVIETPKERRHRRSKQEMAQAKAKV